MDLTFKLSSFFIANEDEELDENVTQSARTSQGLKAKALYDYQAGRLSSIGLLLFF